MKQYSTEILIVGGGPGGIFTSKSLLANNITDFKVVCDEPEVVCRCNIPYGIGKKFLNDINDAVTSHHTFLPNFDDVGIVGRISRIDHPNKTAYGTFLKSDEDFSVSYNRLILAMGGQASLPPIKGAINLDYDGSNPVGEVVYYKGKSYDKAALRDNVVVVRSVADARRIDAICGTGLTVAVVGTGLVGIEIIDNLIIRGNKVEVVEILPHLVSFLDADMSTHLEEALKNEGANIHLGKPCTEVGDGYIIVGDQKIKADLVVIGAGVSSDIQLAREVGCEIGKTGGVRVNERCLTSVPDVYAIGDLIEIDDAIFSEPVQFQLLPNVMMQGAIIAKHFKGIDLEGPLAVGAGMSHAADLFWGFAGYSEGMVASRDLNVMAEKIELFTAEHASPYAKKAWYKMVVSAEDQGTVKRGQIIGFQAITQEKHLGDLMARWADIIGEKETVWDLPKHNWIHQPLVGNPPSNAYIMTFFTMFTGKLEK
ncbi:MAG: FAD-dependent oxidoreductase [Deltaproteobacteria bacterium]|nr:FAD-dependent oxidoreductase [Deltaproteobacteria bacterium]